MTISDRAERFNATFARYPAAHLRVVRERGHDVLYGTWVLGNDYRNATRLYGAYPPGYLARVMALFPDTAARIPGIDYAPVLHVFSGSLPEGPYVRCDLRQEAEIQADVAELSRHAAHRGYGAGFWLALADPPYSAEDARKYGTPMINRRRVLEELAAVVVPGGYLAWLDCVWPMHRKAQWTTVGRIAVVRSTNHRVRLLTLFERTAGEEERHG